MKRYEDLYFNKGGALVASLRLQAKISRVMTCEWATNGRCEEGVDGRGDSRERASGGHVFVHVRSAIAGKP